MSHEFSEDMYREQIMDYYKHPRNKGVLKNATMDFSDYNPMCGDEIRFQAVINGIIKDVKFEGNGCAISQSAASMLTEELKGKKPSEVMKFDKEYVMEILGIPISVSRIKCAMLGLRTFQKGLVRSSMK